MSQISFLQLQLNVGRRFKTKVSTPWPKKKKNSRSIVIFKIKDKGLFKSRQM